MIDLHPFMLTKIIATLGPSSDKVETLVRLIEEGARTFRLNFSHGTFDGFEKLLATVREASRQAGIHVGVLGDLCGPKIRIGEVIDGGVIVEVGDTLVVQKKPIKAGDVPSTRPDGGTVFSITTPQIIDDVQPGDRLLIDDGSVRTLVAAREGEGDDARLLCQVTVGGKITRAKGVNLPDSKLTVPSLTPYDLQCVDWAVKHQLDHLALSFVRKAEDVIQLKQRLMNLMPADVAPMPVISKIEKPQALNELEEIVMASDAVMVARGDLGVEMDLTEVPVIQKRIIAMAHACGRPVIVATQMLQSMIDSPWPTRAEVSDVANAIFDGAGKVMLSGETAVGKYPTQAVGVMARIARVTQKAIFSEQDGAPIVWDRPPKWQTSGRRSAALSFGVRSIVRDFGARFVVVWSQRGGGAKYLSLSRVAVPILAMSNDEAALRRMSFLYGVYPIMMDVPTSIEAYAATVEKLILARQWGRPRDPYVLVAGEPLGVAGTTNSVSLRYLNAE
ncbi:MAG: pyruvate kinase [Phycisphaeraceae bacterium]